MRHRTGHQAERLHPLGVGQLFQERHLLLQGDLVGGDVADGGHLHLAALVVDVLDADLHREGGAVLADAARLERADGLRVAPRVHGADGGAVKKHAEHLPADEFLLAVAEHPAELRVGLEQGAPVVDDDALPGGLGQLAEALFAGAQLPLQLFVLDGVLEGAEQSFRGAGLADVVVDALAERFNGVVDGGVAGQNDDRGVGVVGAQVRGDLGAGHVGQVDVHQRRGVAALLQAVERLGPGVGEIDLVAFGLEKGLQTVAESDGIVNEENGMFHGHRGHLSGGDCQSNRSLPASAGAAREKRPSNDF